MALATDGVRLRAPKPSRACVSRAPITCTGHVLAINGHDCLYGTLRRLPGCPERRPRLGPSHSHQGAAGAGGSARAPTPQPAPSDLDKEIASIALPMLATLAADPIAGLIDTAYMGRLGSNELAGVGVALSIFNTASKLLNVPLLFVTTSSVAAAVGVTKARAAEARSAAAEAATAVADNTSTSVGASAPAAAAPEPAGSGPTAVTAEEDEAAAIRKDGAVGRAVSSALLLAACIGLLQALGLGLGGSWIISQWGVAPGSELYGPVAAFLGVRALGAPITTMLLTLQGVFRGLQDTRTPLAATLAANALNVALAPLLIFTARYGAGGAALATVASQALPTAVLAWQLGRRVCWGMEPSQGPLGTLLRLLPLFKPTGFLVLRTLSVTATYAVANNLVARAGATAAAGHHICFQVWLASSLLADALAVSAQSLMARDLGAGNAEAAQRVAGRVSSLSLLLGLGLGAGVALGAGGLPRLFTQDAEVVRYAAGIVPIVAATQPINALAFAWDGILYGAGGFQYAACAMAVSAVPAIAAMQLAPQLFAGLPERQLAVIWGGLALLMLLRWLTLAVPYKLKAGPFAKLRRPAASESGGGTAGGG